MRHAERAALLAATLLLAAAAPRRHGPATDANPIHVEMRDVVLYPYDDVPASVSALSGTVAPERPGRPVVFDDPSSYRIDAAYSEMRLSAADLAILMNRHILAGGRTAIREVSARFEDGAVALSGTLVKLGLPIPFTATATLEPTATGDLRVHVTAMKAAGLIPKGLIDAVGLPLSTLAQPSRTGVFHIDGDDLVVPVASMFPPPRVTGRLTAVRVTPEALVAVIGHPVPLAAAPAHAASYLHYVGGSFDFAKLTMHDSDLTVVGQDDHAPLAYAPAHYYAQLEAGSTQSLPDFGLVARVRDFRTVGATSARIP